MGLWGKGVRGRPTRKWPGVRFSKPSSDSEWSGWSGRLFKTASTSHRIVEYSSRLSEWLRRIFLSRVFVDFTPASHKPSKCGACPGLNFHLIWCLLVNDWRVLRLSGDSRRLYIACSLLFAPTKFVPLSVMISWGIPLLAMKHLSAAMKSVVDKLQTSSRCIALLINKWRVLYKLWLWRACECDPF